MTTAKTGKRQTALVYQGRPLVVELAPGYLKLRCLGRRNSEVAVDYAAIYELGMKMQARANAGKGKS